VEGLRNWKIFKSPRSCEHMRTAKRRTKGSKGKGKQKGNRVYDVKQFQHGPRERTTLIPQRIRGRILNLGTRGSDYAKKIKTQFYASRGSFCFENEKHLIGTEKKWGACKWVSLSDSQTRRGRNGERLKYPGEKPIETHA